MAFQQPLLSVCSLLPCPQVQVVCQIKPNWARHSLSVCTLRSTIIKRRVRRSGRRPSVCTCSWRRWRRGTRRRGRDCRSVSRDEKHDTISCLQLWLTPLLLSCSFNHPHYLSVLSLDFIPHPVILHCLGLCSTVHSSVGSCGDTAHRLTSYHLACTIPMVLCRGTNTIILIQQLRSLNTNLSSVILFIFIANHQQINLGCDSDKIR